MDLHGPHPVGVSGHLVWTLMKDDVTDLMLVPTCFKTPTVSPVPNRPGLNDGFRVSAPSFLCCWTQGPPVFRVRTTQSPVSVSPLSVYKPVAVQNLRTLPWSDPPHGE